MFLEDIDCIEVTNPFSFSFFFCNQGAKNSTFRVLASTDKAIHRKETVKMIRLRKCMTISCDPVHACEHACVRACDYLGPGH